LRQKVRTFASEKPTLSPLSAKCPYWTTVLTADVFYGQPLKYARTLNTIISKGNAILTGKALTLNINISNKTTGRHKLN